MKITITIILALALFGANAQKKLTATNSVQYDELGVVQYIDSNAFTYNNWAGSIYSYEPQFGFEGAVFDYSLDEPRVRWNVQTNYSGTSLPLAMNGTWNNTFTAENLILSESTNDKSEFIYDAGGNLINTKFYYWDGTNFILNFEVVSEYNAGNKLTFQEEIYHGNGSPETQSIDSLFYNASDQMVRSVTNAWDGVAFYEVSESFITYSGTEVDNIQLWEGDVSTPLAWAYDIYYTYSGGRPTNIDAYQVVSGVPETTIFIEINYTYGTNNKVSMKEFFVGGDLFQQVDYVYDAQGFVTQNTSSELDFNTSLTYVSEVKKFYYQSTADLNEVIAAEATVFPNPSTDFISIQSNEKIEQVAVFNMNGNLMLTQNSGDISIANLPAGIYIAKVKTAIGVAQARFVKQ